MIAEAFVTALAVYAVLGLLFGIFFVTALVQRMDPAAKGAGLAFRLMILPGTALLWPLLAARVVRRGR
jgi:hypothetical protein